MVLTLVITPPSYRPQRVGRRGHRRPGVFRPGSEELYLGNVKTTLPILGITGEIGHSWSSLSSLKNTIDPTELRFRHFRRLFTRLFPGIEDDIEEHYLRINQPPPVDQPVARMMSTIFGRELSEAEWWILEVEALSLAVDWLHPGASKDGRTLPSEQFARQAEECCGEEAGSLPGRWPDVFGHWNRLLAGKDGIRPCLEFSQDNPDTERYLTIASLSEYFLRMRCRGFMLEPAVMVDPSNKRRFLCMHRADQLMPLAWSEILSAIWHNVFAKRCWCGRAFAIGRQPRKETCSSECARALKKQRFRYQDEVGEEAYRIYMRDKKRESRQRNQPVG